MGALETEFWSVYGQSGGITSSLRLGTVNALETTGVRARCAAEAF